MKNLSIVVPILLVLSVFQPAIALAETRSCVSASGSVLKLGSVSAEVKTLQQFLNSDPTTAIALSGPGSKGQETERFGSLTRKAVISFQEKYAADVLVPAGLAKGTGIVGSLTRARLGALCGSVLGVSTPAPAPVPAFTVTAAPVQPRSGIAPSGALYVPFTDVQFTAGPEDVTVTEVTVERVGPSSDQSFSNVDLLDEDGFYIDDAYFKSNHQATFNEEFTVPANSTRTLRIAGDMADDLTDHVGELAGLKVIAVKASHDPEDFTPFFGSFQSMNNTLVLGSATVMLSGDDPRAARTRYINDNGTRFSAIRLTAGAGEDLLLSAISWHQSGSASATDITNTATVINGMRYAAVEDDRYYTSLFPTPIRIQRGNSVDFYIEGDLTTTGSNRTVQFDIESATDILLTGSVYGFGIYPTPEADTDVSGNSVFLTSDGTTDGDSGFPYFVGSVVNISHGALGSIGKF